GIPRNLCPAVRQSVLQEMNDLERDAKELKREAELLEQSIIDNEKNPAVTNTELQSLINTYNTTIRLYNTMVLAYTDIVDTYNKQIAEFDRCTQTIRNE